MKTKEVDIGGGKKIEITYFDNPMMHEDWHKAEAAGLVYSRYEGPDCLNGDPETNVRRQIDAGEELI
jgi:hypothetical protein